ncbi:SH2 domain-containing protein 6 [Emydura macquarii macquarii]|uniref:SH2 domain-containing protein 6 n=1 Tax=Emydura macquarii macquarii TaxID=1129001 RepID=UPI00352A9B58
MYEAPPCEGQVQKVAPAKRQETADGTYLDHASARRCSEPLPLLPAKFLSKCSLVPGTDVGQVEEIPRGLASGKDPSPTSWDNKEGPPEEELYLECELMPGPSDPEKYIRSRTFAKQPVRPLDDRDAEGTLPEGEAMAEKLNEFFASDFTADAACRVPPPRPPKLPRPKIALPVVRHGPAETSPGASSPGPAWPGGSGSPVEDPSMQDQAWYAGSCDRHTAESLLHGLNKDSAFMVRQSSGQGWKQPFTLAVLYQGHVYNIPIRYLEGSRRYALGKEGKRHEELFDSVPSIIQHYSQRPLVLIEGSSSARAHTCLLFPVKP